MAPSVVKEDFPNPITSTNKTDSSQQEQKPAAVVIEQVQLRNRTVTGQELHIRQYPKFNSLEEERLYRKQHLAAAFRVFADRGFDEGVAGHISVRDPVLTDHFCMFLLFPPSLVLSPPFPFPLLLGIRI